MIKARKRFGQNFLNDRGIISRIVRSIDIKPEDNLLEIGPGTGALTHEILRESDNLTLIEIDRDLAATLQETFPNIRLINDDVMKVDVTKVAPGKPLRIIGNLPYNISTPLLFKLFKEGDCIQDMHFMLQLEVVDRMSAEHDSRSYGRLSIMTQLHCHAEKLFEVPREAFTPRPKVTSAIVRLTPRAKPDNLDLVLMESLLIQAFSARRKTIRNALKSFLSESDLEQLNLDPRLRPENLTVDDYVRCCQAVSGKSA